MDTQSAWKRRSSGCSSPTFSAAAPFFNVTTHASTLTISLHSAQHELSQIRYHQAARVLDMLPLWGQEVIVYNPLYDFAQSCCNMSPLCTAQADSLYHHQAAPVVDRLTQWVQ